MPTRHRALIAAIALLAACQPAPRETAPAPAPVEIDQRSYDLGVIGAFSEVVQMGVKRLALSAALSPDEMAALLPEAREIAARHDVQLFHETDFLTTDLFPQSLTDGKEVLLIYRDPVKDEYMAIRADRDALIADGRYEGPARADIARRFGRLLSYSDDEIDRLLAPRMP